MAISWILDDGAGRVPGLRIGIVPNRSSRRGVPTIAAFVGFADAQWPVHARGHRRAASPGISCRRHADFVAAVRPDERSYLGAAVRGFFANGGRECIVFPMSAHADVEAAATPSAGAAARARRADEILRLLEPGGALEDRDDIGLLCIPDAVSADLVGEDLRVVVQERQVAHCEATGDRFAILDAPGPALAVAGVVHHPLPVLPDALRSGFAAMYYPWVVPDRTRDAWHEVKPASVQWRRAPAAQVDPGGGRPVPPSGHVAGLYARADGRHGTHRAPANMIVFGTRDLTRDTSLAEMARLGDEHVNCIAHVPAVGLCVIGARTLSFHPHNRFVSTKRVVLDLRRWIERGLADLVFEPDSAALQERLRDRLVLHCLRLWRAGAIAGTTPGEAFWVKCDAETNPPSSREGGRLVAEVGIAPSVPAEFVEVRVVRDAYGFAVTGQ